jgi:hypothetical protein
MDAGVAQLAEQLFCKQQVTGSIPVAGSSLLVLIRLRHDKSVPEDACQRFG